MTLWMGKNSSGLINPIYINKWRSRRKWQGEWETSGWDLWKSVYIVHGMQWTPSFPGLFGSPLSWNFFYSENYMPEIIIHWSGSITLCGICLDSHCDHRICVFMWLHSPIPCRFWVTWLCDLYWRSCKWIWVYMVVCHYICGPGMEWWFVKGVVGLFPIVSRDWL